VYGLTVNEQKLLAKGAGERAWVPVMDLPEQPLTGLTRKILKRLRVMPGYSGSRPAIALGELAPPDSAQEFDTALFSS
jgi:A/G-specific adenine glycosylase